MKRFALVVLALAALSIHHAAFIVHGQTLSVREYRRAHEADIINEFVELLAIPNVASDTANIRRNAEHIIAMMNRRGIQTRLLEGNGPPAVFGEPKASIRKNLQP